MFRVFIISEGAEQVINLSTGLIQQGFTCTISSSDEDAIEHVIEQAPDSVLLDITSPSSSLMREDLIKRIKQRETTVVIALLSLETLNCLDSMVSVDDFVIEPWAVTEVAIRAKRILRRRNPLDNDEVIVCGDLVINVATCEVSLGSKLIELTFKEYELLRFLASNQGRVFTREALLNKVWGYDYFGGDRTVDVHIRRLRSKIEDPTHTFVDTVRNIGYRFKKEL